MDDMEHTQYETTSAQDDPSRMTTYPGAMGYRSESYDMLVEGRSLKEYPIIIFRHRFLILLLVMFGLGVAGLKNHYSVRSYTSNSMVNIGRFISPQAGDTGKVLQQQTSGKDYVKTQIPLLESYLIAKRVLAINPVIKTFIENPGSFEKDSFENADPKWIAIQSNESGETLNPYSLEGNYEKRNDISLQEDDIAVPLLKAYLDSISFSQVKDTTLVRIYATAQRPDMAAIISNAHGLAFIALVKEQQMMQANVNIGFLEERLIEATEKAEQAVAAQLEFAKKHGIVGGETGVIDSTYEAQFRDLVKNLNEAIFEKVESEASYRTLQRQNGFGRVTTGNQSASEALRLARIESDYIKVSRENGKNSSQARFLKDKMEAVRGALRQFGKSQITDAQTAYRMASRRENALRNEFERLHEQELQTSEHKVQYDLLTKELIAAEAVQAELSVRLDDAIFAADNMQETVQLVDPAIPPSRANGLNESSNLFTGALLGGIIGIFVAFFLDFLDNTIRTMDDLESALDLAALGFIPRFSESLITASTTAAALAAEGEEVEGEDVSSFSDATVPVLISAPLSAESESFRSLFTALTHTVPGGEPRVILVTSGQQSDGKSTIAANLAVAFAQAEHSTILVDIDLRLPSVQSFFPGQDSSAGVLNYLSGDEDLHGLISKTSVEDLKVFFAGGVAHNPTALLRSERLSDLIEILASEYEFVIIDSPPVGPVADAQLLSRLVDAVLMVVRSGITPKPVAQSAVQRLRQVNAPIVGAVLNDAKRSDNYRDASYYRMQSGYFNYGYNGYNEKSVKEIQSDAEQLAITDGGSDDAFNETVAVVKDDAIAKAVEKASQKSLRKSSATGKRHRKSARKTVKLPWQALVVLGAGFILTAFLAWSHLDRQSAPKMAMFDVASRSQVSTTGEYAAEVEGEGYIRDLDAEEAAANGEQETESAEAAAIADGKAEWSFTLTEEEKAAIEAARAKAAAEAELAGDEAGEEGVATEDAEVEAEVEQTLEDVSTGEVFRAGSAEKKVLTDGWYLQVATFPRESLASDFVEFFKSTPFTANVNKRVIGNTTLYRVLVGPYEYEAEAKADVAELRKRGLTKSSPITRQIGRVKR